MVNRSANAAIAGYLYQFDRTMVEILGADAEAVTVEGIEDIDLDTATETTAVQCKYLVSSEYSLTQLRRPLQLMLDEFTNGRRVQYRVYAHFKSGSEMPSSLSLADLKKCLTETKRLPLYVTLLHYAAYADSVLEDFLAHLSLVNGSTLIDQREVVYERMIDALGGSLEDCDDLFYGKALDVVCTLATQADIQDRRITKVEFIRQIDRKSIMYTRWHKERVGHVKFLSGMRRRAETEKSLKTNKWRTVFLDVNDRWSYDQYLQLGRMLARKGFGPGLLRNARPWTLVVAGDGHLVTNFKAALLRDGLRLNDGFEEVVFMPPAFDAAPIVNCSQSGRLTKTSYDLRFVRYENFIGASNALRAWDTLVILSGRPDFSIDLVASRSLLDLRDLPADSVLAWLTRFVEVAR